MNIKDPASRCAFVFGRPMKPCPACGGYRLGFSVPIKMDRANLDTAKKILAEWAKRTRDGNTPLEGTCRIVCRDCHHMGPSVDVVGRTAEDVGRDAVVASRCKELWNGVDNVKVQEEGKA